MYYHYTSYHGAMAISSSGHLQPSQKSGAFGPGVYLTDLDPYEFFRDEILENNYGGIKSEFHNRADWVVEITENNINMQLLRQVHVPGDTDRRIFVYPYFISIRPDQIYDKPRCKSYVDENDSGTSTDNGDDSDDCSESEDDSYSYQSEEDGFDGSQDAGGDEEYESDEASDFSSQGEENKSTEFKTGESEGEEIGSYECGTDNYGDDSYVGSEGYYYDFDDNHSYYED